jgi:hypothetical protein
MVLQDQARPAGSLDEASNRAALCSNANRHGEIRATLPQW